MTIYFETLAEELYERCASLDWAQVEYALDALRGLTAPEMREQYDALKFARPFGGRLAAWRAIARRVRERKNVAERVAMCFAPAR